jgi:hypothetical protein
LRLATVTPRFRPPETLAENLKKQIDPLIPVTDFIGVLDMDVEPDKKFRDLPERVDDAQNLYDIIAPRVVSSSRVYRFLDWFEDHLVFSARIRGCAVWYNMMFLKRVGGFPLVTTPDTWLRSKSMGTLIVWSCVVVHQQNFSLSHGVSNQWRDGKSRAELGYSFWKTVLHSIFRLRPFVLVSYLWTWYHV